MRTINSYAALKKNYLNSISSVLLSYRLHKQNHSTKMSTPMKKTNTTAASEKSFVSTKTVSNDPIRSKRCMIQNYLVIWADANIDPSNDGCQKALTQLQKVVSQLNFFTTLAECIEFLNRLDKEKVFLILSGSFGQTLVPDIHNMSQVDVIYIFCGNETRHKKWAKQWYKIQGIFTSIGPICKALAKAAYQCDNENISMSFVSKQAIEIVDGDSEKGNLNQLEPSYMYSVIFKEIILKMEDDNAKSLKELSKYCLEQKVEKDEIDYFVHEYDKKTPIYWYSCQMFIYGMLNRALRTLDMGTMAKLGFFIRHLHRQLERLHEEQVGQFQKQFLVYRGQGLSQEDFNHLREIQDGLLSFNNFLSTSSRLFNNFVSFFIIISPCGTYTSAFESDKSSSSSSSSSSELAFRIYGKVTLIYSTYL
ncbi:unnamed protein product [Rotaria socialis]